MLRAGVVKRQIALQRKPLLQVRGDQLTPTRLNALAAEGRAALLQARPQAAAVEVPINQLTDTQRAQLATELGYDKIGKELPNNVSLTDIVKTLPPEVNMCAPCLIGTCYYAIAGCAMQLCMFAHAPVNVLTSWFVHAGV